MNFRKFALAALAASAFISCEKNHEGQGEFVSESVELEVKIPYVGTRSDGTENEDRINNVQVFVFDHNKMLEAYASEDGAENSIVISCSTGQKEVVALVNAIPLADVKSVADLEARKTSLSDNTFDSFVMEGRTITTLQTNSSVEVSVSRIAARVVVTEVSVDLEMDQLNSQTFQIKSMYLINVAGERTFLKASEPAKWFNKMQKESDAPSITEVTLTDAYATVTAPYSEPQYMYCYPNPTASDVSGGPWSARFTRLVVEAELGGKLYYYPVSLKEGINSNTSYEIKMIITRPGSSSPDKPVDSMTAGFTVKVLPWNDATLVEEII